MPQKILHSQLFQTSVRLRDRKGRFCTRQQKRNEMLSEENSRLRYERNLLAIRNSELQREIIVLQSKLDELL